VTTVPMPDVREAAISVAVAAIRGDNDTIRRELCAHADDGFAALIRATLVLLRELARKLRSVQGLMAVDVRLSEISREHGSREIRTAAQLILGHAMTCRPPNETATAAETFADFHDIGADAYNDACDAADLWFVDMFTTAMMLLRQLLPEADTYMVSITAGQLWGSRSVEPIPPKLEGTTVKSRIRDENGPRPTLPRTVGTEVAVGGPERRPTIPAGAPVSLRGLAIRRQQERGVDVIYG
jgi:hypothetical protein